MPDPEWPPCMGNIKAARGIPVPCRLHEDLGWRYDLGGARIDDHAADPRGLHQLAAQPHRRRADARRRRGASPRSCRERGLWLVADEAYEDVLFDGAEHVSAASLPGMYERTISVFTFSKSYAMTGLRLGYVVCSDAQRARADEEGAVLYLQQRHLDRAVRRRSVRSKDPQDSIETFRARTPGEARSLLRRHPRARRRRVLRRAAAWRVLRVPADRATAGERRIPEPGSRSWAMAEHLIARGRIGCVPGVDFGANGEGYIRFCFARERAELGRRPRLDAGGLRLRRRSAGSRQLSISHPSSSSMSTSGFEMCPRMKVRGPGDRFTSVGVNAMLSCSPIDGFGREIANRQRHFARAGSATARFDVLDRIRGARRFGADVENEFDRPRAIRAAVVSGPSGVRPPRALAARTDPPRLPRAHAALHAYDQVVEIEGLLQHLEASDVEARDAP